MMPGPLPREEIVRELKRYRHDRAGETLGGKRVPLKSFADFVGISRQALNEMIHGEMGIAEHTRIRMTQAILDIRAGRLRFRRRDREWIAEGPAVEDI
jgi:hypothetical protein